MLAFNPICKDSKKSPQSHVSIGKVHEATGPARVGARVGEGSRKAVNGRGHTKKLPAQSLREKRKITLTNFLERNCESLQFRKFKLNVIACFTMKKHINHIAKLVCT